MNLKEYAVALLKLQNSLYSAVRLNDALIDIIEIGFADTGDAVYCPSHTHTWFEFNYVTSGSFFTSFGQEMQEIGEGMFFLIPPGMEHSHRYNSKKPHNDIFLRWQIKKTDNEIVKDENSLYEQLKPLYLWNRGCCRDDGTLRLLFEQMFKHAGHNATPINLQLDFINILFVLLNLSFNNEVQEDGIIQRYNRDNAGKTIIKKVEVYLNDCKLEKFDVQSLAASLHMSYGHLARLYKKYSGQTIHDRLCNIRIEKSCMLLAQTDYSIKEIAEKLEFSNQYYFSKVFKDINGINPSQYRKSCGL